LAPPRPTEPELREAVADLDAGSTGASAPAEAPSPPPAQEQPEPPRRRSTVRERAPVAASDATSPEATAPPTPAPEPVITEVSGTEKADQPRRTGWWSRRFAGG
jgi:ribonuclease E